MDKLKLFSSLLFSSLLVILAALGMISCDNGLSPSEYSPLLDDPPLEGFWRIEGAIDAPLDWDPTEDSNLVKIWFGGTDPIWPLSNVESSITYTLVFTSQDYRRWHFKAEGPYTYQSDPYHAYFCPPSDWWSHPDSGTPVFRRTWVQGYIWEEFGGGFHLVKADEDWSYSPKNYADGIPRPDWKYGHAYPGGPQYYWEWTSVYLDLTD
jgi:hypothetical protein